LGKRVALGSDFPNIRLKSVLLLCRNGNRRQHGCSVGIGTTKPFEFVERPDGQIETCRKAQCFVIARSCFQTGRLIPKFGMYKVVALSGRPASHYRQGGFPAALTGALLVRMIIGEYPQQELFQKGEKPVIK
jgi:uncharacterized protein YbbC (DUF1343 family)